VTPRRARTLVARWVTAALVLAVVLHRLVYWVEAEKELRILCGLSRAGTSAVEIDRLFGTANLLEIARTDQVEGARLVVSSVHNAHASGCVLELRRGVVTASTWREAVRLSRPATWLGLALLVALVVLHTGLAAGAPWGALAWGGANARPSGRWRVASAVVAGGLLFGVACLSFVAGRFAPPAPVAVVLVTVAEAWLGVLVLACLLGVFVHLASTSRWERWLRTPVAFLLACAGVVLLLGG